MTLPWSIPFAAGFFAYPIIRYISLSIREYIDTKYPKFVAKMVKKNIIRR